MFPFADFAPVAALVGFAAVAGWVFTTWLRVKNGYPLDGAWGQAVYPKTSDESVERIKLLSSENAQLRAELSSLIFTMTALAIVRNLPIAGAGAR